MRKLVLFFLMSFVLVACNLEDVPPAHRGWVFEQSAWGSTNGFIGPVVSPGTHNLGYENDLYLVQCTESTVRENIASPSKNGVTFGADIYLRFSAHCESDEAVKWVLRNVQPNPELVRQLQRAEAPAAERKDGEAPSAPPAFTDDYLSHTVTAHQLFHTYARPALGAAIRDALARFESDQINLQREEIAKAVDAELRKKIGAAKPVILKIAQFDLSNIYFPETMKGTMERLANVKTEIELEKQNATKVDQQIATARKEKELSMARAQKVGTEISEIGRLVKENPAYLDYLKIQNEASSIERMPQAFEALGKGGGTIVFGGNGGPMTMMLDRGTPRAAN